MYPDLYAARDLVNAGAAAVMPLAAPIGSNKGLATREFIQILVDEIDLPVIVDAGIGRPSQACEAMEMGAAAIMANTALATAGDLPMMAAAFKNAVEAGRKAYLSGLGRVLTRGASASDPLTGFLHDCGELWITDFLLMGNIFHPLPLKRNTALKQTPQFAPTIWSIWTEWSR